MDNEEVPAKVLTAVREVLVPQVLLLTHPVFALHGDAKLELLGSCIIVASGEDRYVVTASHLANQASSARLMFGAGDELRELRGKRWRVTTANALSGADDDRADVSVIRLNGAVAVQLPEDAATPLTAIEFESVPDIRNPVLLLGYPCTKHRRARGEQPIEANVYSVVAFETELAEYNALAIDRSTHLAVSFNRKEVWHPGGGGTAPRLNGMSGSGVWRLSVFGGVPASSVRLAGLFIEHHQKVQIKHAIATRLTAVLSVIARTEPDLRDALAAIGVRVA